MTEPVWFADAVGMAFILFWCLGGLYMLFCLFMASGLGDLLSWFTSDQGDPTQLIGMDVTATRRVLEEFGFRGPSWGMRSDEYPGVFVTLRQDESALEVDFGVIPYWL